MPIIARPSLTDCVCLQLEPDGVRFMFKLQFTRTQEPLPGVLPLPLSRGYPDTWSSESADSDLALQPVWRSVHDWLSGSLSPVSPPDPCHLCSILSSSPSLSLSLLIWSILL